MRAVMASISPRHFTSCSSAPRPCETAHSDCTRLHTRLRAKHPSTLAVGVTRAAPAPKRRRSRGCKRPSGAQPTAPHAQERHRAALTIEHAAPRLNLGRAPAVASDSSKKADNANAATGKHGRAPGRIRLRDRHLQNTGGFSPRGPAAHASSRTRGSCTPRRQRPLVSLRRHAAASRSAHTANVRPHRRCSQGGTAGPCEWLRLFHLLR
jgi:hypothetical protein